MVRAPTPRRAWKQVRQYTGRSSVGLKGTVVFWPQDEQVTSCSSLAPGGPDPGPGDRLTALQPLHRFGSFWNPFWTKNSCSPAVNTKTCPQSTHVNVLSWNGIRIPPSVDDPWLPLRSALWFLAWLPPCDVGTADSSEPVMRKHQPLDPVDLLADEPPGLLPGGCVGGIRIVPEPRRAKSQTLEGGEE